MLRTANILSILTVILVNTDYLFVHTPDFWQQKRIFYITFAFFTMKKNQTLYFWGFMSYQRSNEGYVVMVGESPTTTNEEQEQFFPERN